MGTETYSCLIEVLLREGPKTKEEILQEAIGEKWGFPEGYTRTWVPIMLAIKERSGHILEDEDGRYHFLESDGRTVRQYLGFLDRVTEDYLEERPHIKKLKQALGEALLK